jgi:hypothetical protein
LHVLDNRSVYKNCSGYLTDYEKWLMLKFD